jgi:starvation-inducible DNA-binding protein
LAQTIGTGDPVFLRSRFGTQDLKENLMGKGKPVRAPRGDGNSIDIGIGDRDRRRIADGLGRVLADTYSLYLKTHNFHWNVEGPMFNTLHLMFMEQYTELWNALDAIAERIRSLGYPAPGTNTEFARLTSIEETPGVPDAMEMVRLLVTGHEAVARTARSVFPTADDAGDESTADLLTQRLQIHEKTAWMLRSLLK